MKKALYKRYDELSSWDLNKGCRAFVSTKSKSARRLKKTLRKQARKRLDSELLV